MFYIRHIKSNKPHSKGLMRFVGRCDVCKKDVGSEATRERLTIKLVGGVPVERKLEREDAERTLARLIRRLRSEGCLIPLADIQPQAVEREFGVLEVHGLPDADLICPECSCLDR